MLEKREAMPGDILAVDRGPYLHYAVYVGDGEVIHYRGRDGDFGGKITVHRAPMSEFLNKNKEFFILDFPKEEQTVTLSDGIKKLLNGEVLELYHQLRRAKDYHLYSPEETVARAESRLGEASYNFITDNCEHFAIWCKTGVSESNQVNTILEKIEKMLVPW